MGMMCDLHVGGSLGLVEGGHHERVARAWESFDHDLRLGAERGQELTGPAAHPKQGEGHPREPAADRPGFPPGTRQRSVEGMYPAGIVHVRRRYTAIGWRSRA